MGVSLWLLKFGDDDQNEDQVPRHMQWVDMTNGVMLSPPVV